MKYTVVVDTREQNPWKFRASSRCEGSVVATLKTGDYTLRGYEDVLCVEKKATAQEFYGNICTSDLDRFRRELKRMSSFKYAYVILCFSLRDIIKYPWTSDLPISVKRRIGSKGDFFLRRFVELQIEFPQINFVLVDDHPKEFVTSLFKRVVDDHNAGTDA